MDTDYRVRLTFAHGGRRREGSLFLTTAGFIFILSSAKTLLNPDAQIADDAAIKHKSTDQCLSRL
jgi:hypothetical protein